MKQREFYYDNAKFLLIFLVVIGHFITTFIGNGVIEQIYIFIYLFHMPAFILVSGYFSKGFQKEGYVLKITKKILVPYFFFQIIYSVYYYFLLDKSELTIAIFKPQWSLWFLLSLFCWHLLLFVFTKIKYSLLVSVLIGIIVGYFDAIGGYLSLSRTFVLFPVFLLGFYMKKEHFEKLTSNKGKLLSAVAIVIMLFIIHYILVDMPKEWMYGSKSYEKLGAGWEGGIIRLLYYGMSLIMIFSFFTFVPKKEYFFSKWGTRTLYVYLLHGFIIRYFRTTNLVPFIKETGSYHLLLIFAVIVTLILVSKPVYIIAQPVLELRMDGVRTMFQRKKMKSRV
ncbi:acyltransferase family protein [Schinkia azotoformans]|uniref:acyltransferase family protein n=1 Tax=Schinkia azotoformans TaxID=1454 RepID=UPI002DBED69A|nr:acyltransferase family protein [Schinkia azotoformans]MEC1722452.1 acyltransferase family protein [Schinkia azotoformans]MED4414826.1 acyltransferase family protein [Schinkia azotoformans]